jgi:His/Glu/Gln/Arg/opine family amino acid ABC transporter permease subunit
VRPWRAPRRPRPPSARRPGAELRGGGHRQFGRGLLLTAAPTGLTRVGALALGLLLAAFRIVPIWPLRAFGAVYVGLIRNLPLLVLLVLFVFGLPEVGLLHSLFPTVAVAMAVYWAAFVCEIVRSGSSPSRPAKPTRVAR